MHNIYYDICIEGFLKPEEIIPYAEKFYDAGAERLSMWDCFAKRVANRSEWFVSSRLGHRQELKTMSRESTAYRRVFRVLKLNGVSLASYNPNWCG